MEQYPRENLAATPVAYTVEQALQLIRQLPLDRMDEEKLISAVRSTLENVGVSIASLLDESSKQEDAITGEIMRLQSDVVALQQAVEQKGAQVAAYQAQLAELASLRERFSR
jgi:uncharacterized protein YlxW (UPF0749 family)